MLTRCEVAPLPRPQGGAALVVGLVLVTAAGLLTAAAMHEVTLEAAKTAHLAARVHARLAAASAIEMALAADTFPESGTTALHYRIGPNADYPAEVTIRHLGTAGVTAAGSAGGVAASYYEIVAVVRGPRGALVRRKRDWVRLASE